MNTLYVYMYIILVQKPVPSAGRSATPGLHNKIPTHIYIYIERERGPRTKRTKHNTL